MAGDDRGSLARRPARATAGQTEKRDAQPNVPNPAHADTLSGTDIWFKASAGTYHLRVRIQLETERCQGHGRCYDLAPALFAPDDVGHAVLLAPDDLVAPEHEPAAHDAVRNCPEQALSFRN